MDPEKTKKEHRRGGSFLLSLLILLILLFSLSMGLLGFALGKRAVSGSGRLMDTIVLSPDQGSGAGDEVTHFLSGRILYPEGDPCVGATVRIKETSISDETDENGKFFFSDIRGGSYTMEVLDRSGTLLADTDMVMSFLPGSSVKADTSVPAFELPVDARMLELTLLVDPQQKSLSVKKEGAYVVTVDGTVSDLYGGQTNPSGYSVLPGGDVVSSSGYTLVAGDSLMILPSGSVIAAEDLTEEEQRQSGMTLQEDGSVSISDGAATVETDGTVSGEDGSIGPSDFLITVTGGETEELTELPEELSEVDEESSSVSSQDPSQESETSYEEQQETSSQPSYTGGIGALETSSQQSSGEGSVSAQEESSQSSEPPASSSEPEPTPTPDPTPTPEPFSFVTQAWTQESLIDLFANRTGGIMQTVEVEDPVTHKKETIPMIAPGSKGSYHFKLKNASTNEIRFTLTIGEESFHLPILYSVRDVETNRIYKGASKVGADRSAITTGQISLPAETEREYELGWEWQLEDWYSPDEDNAIDTAAAGKESVAERTYVVSLGLRAEEVIRLSTGGTSGTTIRYPGVTKY